ncbi:MATE family efflux transporter [Candidatus Gracilibacteria bacterium]|nr:MATE family efflux transporter [Candidatus Gracilibacteria bacterium]MBF0913668.1 MATE family efflux transporter [Candidatus Gracilibacteria bacterium]
MSKKNKTNNMDLALNGSIIKGLFILSVPILIGNLLQSSYNFVDAYWIGTLSKEAVASISASFPIIFFIISLGTGFSMAGTILVAQFAGAKNQEMVNKTASQTLAIDIFLAILLGTIGYFTSEWILGIMGVEKEVIGLALPYMKITFVGLVFSFVFSMFQSIMRGVGEVKLPMYIIGGTVLLNFVVDPALILGFGPIPAFGVAGAAIATVIAQAISAIIGIYIMCKGNHGVKIRIKDMIPNVSFLKKIFVLGLPSSIEMSIRSFGFVLMVNLITSFGTVALAGFGAGGNIFQFIMIPAMGFSIATSTMVGMNLGAKNLKRASDIAKTSSIITFIALEIVGIFTFFFTPELITLFVKDSETIAVGVDMIKISAFTFGIMGIQFSLVGVFRAAGNTTLAMNLGIISQFLIQFPAAYLLANNFKMGVDGIWWSYAITNISMMLICIAIFIRGKWKEKNITDDDINDKNIIEETVIAEGKQ